MKNALHNAFKVRITKSSLLITSSHVEKGSKFVQAGRLIPSQNGVKTRKSQ